MTTPQVKVAAGRIDHLAVCRLARREEADGASFNRFGFLDVMKSADTGGRDPAGRHHPTPGAWSTQPLAGRPHRDPGRPTCRDGRSRDREPQGAHFDRFGIDTTGIDVIAQEIFLDDRSETSTR
ncbi:hypothetical protein [Aquisphaera insulae]|uniref:hypothetical protein n=1 Tax=Aquisphaera insulae TaxID=2712864 RepID=UPI0013EBB44B|nr:hypothetical protein [Aquisphaera insulae]